MRARGNINICNVCEGGGVVLVEASDCRGQENQVFLQRIAGLDTLWRSVKGKVFFPIRP